MRGLDRQCWAAARAKVDLEVLVDGGVELGDVVFENA